MTFLEALLTTFFGLGAALVFGGTMATAFATAPQLHRTLGARQATLAFERVLGVFDRMGFVAALVAAVCAGILQVGFDPSGARWVIEAVLMTTVAAGYAFLRTSLTPKVKALSPPREDGVEDPRSDADKAEFQRLHKLYVRTYAMNLLLATGAFVVLTLPF